MAKWTKPSGLEVETNDEKGTIEHCVSLGWKPVKAAKKPAKKE